MSHFSLCCVASHVPNPFPRFNLQLETGAASSRMDTPFGFSTLVQSHPKPLMENGLRQTEENGTHVATKWVERHNPQWGRATKEGLAA
jgi:hypothetical protein